MKRMIEKTEGLVLALMLLSLPALIFRVMPASANLPATPKNRWTYDSSWLSENAYVSGNMTQLVIGINRSRPNCCAQLLRVQACKGGEAVDAISIGGEKRALVVETPVGSARQLAMDIESTGLAEYVEPNLMFHTSLTPNDPNWTVQWGPAKIGADWAWNYTQGDPSVLVAVIDTGIDYNHTDLSANYVPLGYNWVNGTSDPKDDNGHGTHCAGIIAAELNNGVGVAGIAQVQIMAEKALDSAGYGSAVNLVNAIVNATDAGASIISMSWGGPFSSSAIREAINYSYSKGVLLVAAAGNAGTICSIYPAAYDEVVAVSATAQDDQKASFSSYGRWVELAAPGQSIYSTMPMYSVTLNGAGVAMNYGYLSGTSMACPHVAGVAALIWSKYHNMSRDSVRYWLRDSADDLGAAGFDRYYGYGRLNACRAVEQRQLLCDPMVLDTEVQPCLEANISSTVRGVVFNFGEEDANNTSALLYRNGTLIGNSTRSVLGAGQLWFVDFPWTPTVGSHNLTLRVECADDEKPANNVLAKNITARYPSTLLVPGNYSNLQAAVDLSIRGDQITVVGNCNSETIIDKDNVHINRTGNALVCGMLIEANNVVLEDLAISNTQSACIVMWHSTNVSILDNYLFDAFLGIVIYFSQSNIIKNNNITGIRYDGLQGHYCDSSTIESNSFTYTWTGATEYMPAGIDLISSSHNSITHNGIRGYTCISIPLGGYWGLGIYLDYDPDSGGLGSNNNTVAFNLVRENFHGIYVAGSDNRIHHNNFLDNTNGASSRMGSSTWDDGYASGGNYWSNYNGSDSKWGPYQNRTGCDGIGDTQYSIGANNTDRYPLTGVWTPGTHDVAVTSLSAAKTVVARNETVRINTTISNLGFGDYVSFDETCHLLVYRGNETIQNVTDIFIPEGANYTSSFNWTAPNTVGNYTIVAEVSTVAGETNTTNNIRIMNITVDAFPRLVIGVPQAPPEGVTIWVDGNPYTAYADTPVNITVQSGQHTLQAQYAFLKEEWEPGTYYLYTFDSWSDGYTDNPRNIIITTNTTLQAWYISDDTGIEK
jgi:thermitase